MKNTSSGILLALHTPFIECTLVCVCLLPSFVRRFVTKHTAVVMFVVPIEPAKPCISSATAGLGMRSNQELIGPGFKQCILRSPLLSVRCCVLCCLRVTLQAHSTVHRESLWRLCGTGGKELSILQQGQGKRRNPRKTSWFCLHGKNRSTTVG